MSDALIFRGDCREQLRKLPKDSVHLVVTSPPYFGLRSYGTNPQIWRGDENCEHSWYEIIARNDNASGGPSKKQTSNKGSRHVDYHDRTKKSNICSKCGAWRGELGSEPTLQLFIRNLVLVFREVWRVLRPDGVLFVNIGDSYSRDPKKGGSGPGGKENGNTYTEAQKDRGKPEFKQKDRLGVPHRMVFALQDDGWYWRDEIVWWKPNTIPESVTDRTNKSHEFIFMLTKSPTYFYDHIAIQEQATGSAPGNKTHKGVTASMSDPLLRTKAEQPGLGAVEKRNKRSVWTATVASERDSHFAAYPMGLIEPCILAGTSQRGVCPKCGAQFRRYVKRTRVPSRPGTNTKMNAKINDASLAPGANINRDPQRHITRTQTLGWYPSCTCAGNPPMIKIPRKGISAFRRRALFRRRLKLLEQARDYETVPATVLDPFGGTGTTGAAAISKNRKAILIELNPEYVKLIRKKLKRAKQNKGFGLI